MSIGQTQRLKDKHTPEDKDTHERCLDRHYASMK
jgi:hypothetical protein